MKKIIDPLKVGFLVIVAMIPLSGIVNVVFCEIRSRNCSALYKEVAQSSVVAAGLITAAMSKFNGDDVSP